MKESPATPISEDEPQRYQAKRRRCLRCRVEFESEWSGERVCARCKTSQAWRDGTASNGRTINTGQRRSGPRD